MLEWKSFPDSCFQNCTDRFSKFFLPIYKVRTFFGIHKFTFAQSCACLSKPAFSWATGKANGNKWLYLASADLGFSELWFSWFFWALWSHKISIQHFAGIPSHAYRKRSVPVMLQEIKSWLQREKWHQFLRARPPHFPVPQAGRFRPGKGETRTQKRSPPAWGEKLPTKERSWFKAESQFENGSLLSWKTQ